MRKMIPTDFVLPLPSILEHRCTCYKSHGQGHFIRPRVRREFLKPVKMAENLIGYARKKRVLQDDDGISQFSSRTEA